MKVHRRSRRPAPGFTLLEVMVVSAIIGIVSALSYTGFQRLRDRTEGTNGVRELEGVLRQARGEAFARGLPSVFYIRPLEDGRLEYGLVIDQTLSFDPSDLNASIEAADEDAILVQSLAPTGLSFKEGAGYEKAEKLPAPFAGVPADKPCTFCPEGSSELVVVFRSDGVARLGRDPEDHPAGGSFSLISKDLRAAAEDQGAIRDAKTIAIVSRNGVVSAFDH